MAARKIQLLNLNKYDALITGIEDEEKAFESEYHISVGNDSYYQVLTNPILSDWSLVKINKKSKKTIQKRIDYKEIFTLLLNNINTQKAF